MSAYVTVPLLAVVVLVQSTLMPATALGATKPFLPLLVVVSWGLLVGPLAGAWWALALGLMLDVVSPSPWLFYTVPLLGVVTVVAAGRSRMFPSNLLMPWLVVAAATIVYGLVQWTLLVLFAGTAPWSPYDVLRALLPETALNLLWLPVAFFPLRALSRRIRGPRIEWER